MSSTADEETILAIVADQQKAWNRGDAERFGVRFHEEGSFTNILGDVFHGRTAFIERHDFIFRTVFHGSNAALSIRRIHLPVDDAAIVDIDSALTGYAGLPAGASAPADGILRTSLLEVFIKNGDGWWIAAFHNVDIKPRRA